MPLSAFSDVMHILSWVISGCLQLLEIYWNFIVPPGNFLTDDISILIKFDLQCRRYSVNINSCMNDHICNTLVTAVVSGWSNTLFFIKLPTARRLYSLTMSVCLFICLFFCLSPQSDSLPVSPRQGSPVPRELLPPHIGLCQSSVTSIFHPPPSRRIAALLAVRHFP